VKQLKEKRFSDKDEGGDEEREGRKHCSRFQKLEEGRIGSSSSEEEEEEELAGSKKRFPTRYQRK
jgi:hypothetical protein